MSRLRDRVVLVTAAGGDAGAVVAEAIAGAGGIAIRADPQGPPAVDHSLDVSRETDWRTLVERIASDHGRLDGLVNLASLTSSGNVEETTLAAWRRSLEVEVLGPFLGIRAAWALLGVAGGSVVNVSPATGLIGAADDATASATAGALRQLTRAAALDGARQAKPIRVNAVYGALTDRPEDIAAWVLYLLSDESAFVTGASYVLDGGTTVA